MKQVLLMIAVVVLVGCDSPKVLNTFIPTRTYHLLYDLSPEEQRRQLDVQAEPSP